MIHVVLASHRGLINEACGALGPRWLLRKHTLVIRRLIYQTYDGRQIEV